MSHYDSKRVLAPVEVREWGRAWQGHQDPKGQLPEPPCPLCSCLPTGL